MSKVSSFGYSNDTASTHLVTPQKLGFTSNYAVTKDTANEASLDNKTAPTDQQELISFRSRPIAQVDNDLNIQYPSPVKKGIQYWVTVQETLSTTDTDNPDFRVDEPIHLELEVRHPRSGNITGDIVGTALIRLLSALRREDGSWRFDDLMRSAERPVVD